MVSRHVFNRRLARGVYVPVHGNVVRLASHAPTHSGRTWAAFLSVGRPAAVAGLSAALLLEIPDIADSGETTLVVPMNRRGGHRPGLVVRRLREWPDRSWTSRFGLPVSSLADTVVDLAALLPPGRTKAILEQLLWRRLSVAEVQGRLSRGRCGSAEIRRALTELSDGHRSTAERRLAAGLRRRRVPAFASNQLLQDRYGPIAEVDFLWRRLRVAVQIDGWRYHAYSAFQQDHDVSTTLVVDRDYVVLRFTGADVETRLDWVMDQIEAVLRRQATRLSLPYAA